MKKTCPQCQGNGTVDVLYYREPADADAYERIVEPQTRWLARIVKGIAALVAVAFFFGVLGPWCVRWDKANTLAREGHHQWFLKMGYVVAQYDASKRVTRCWVVGPAGDYYDVRGPALPFAAPDLGWIEVPDRNDIDGYARKIGVADPTKCER